MEAREKEEARENPRDGELEEEGPKEINKPKVRVRFLCGYG